MVCLSCSVRVSAGGAADANQPGLFSSSVTLFGEKPTSLGDDTAGPSIYRVMLSLMLVAGLAFGAMYLSKRVLPKVSGMAGKRVKVVETVSLGSRRALHLVAVGGREILIASTQTTVTRLADFSADELDAETESAEGAK